MNWLLYFKVFLSVFVAFLTIGGAFFVFTIDQLKEYEVKEKFFRISIGLLMFISGLGICILYRSYS